MVPNKHGWYMLNFCGVRGSEAAVSFHNPEFAHVFSFWKYVKNQTAGAKQALHDIPTYPTYVST